MITPKLNDTRVVFGPCRLSYVHLLQKHSTDNNPDNAKYSCDIIIPKDEKETLKAIKSAIEAAKQAGISSRWSGKEPKSLMMPLRDGDEKEDAPEYQGAWHVNAKCNDRPNVVDTKRNPIIDEEEVYSGMWGIVSVSFYAYDRNGNKGVACGLNNVMKTKDDDHLGGRMSAEADFAGIDLEDEDDDL